MFLLGPPTHSRSGVPTHTHTLSVHAVLQWVGGGLLIQLVVIHSCIVLYALALIRHGYDEELFSGLPIDNVLWIQQWTILWAALQQWTQIIMRRMLIPLIVVAPPDDPFLFLAQRGNVIINARSCVIVIIRAFARNCAKATIGSALIIRVIGK